MNARNGEVPDAFGTRAGRTSSFATLSPNAQATPVAGLVSRELILTVVAVSVAVAVGPGHRLREDRRVSELRFDGRVAVVTGAGGGLGRAYALLLASRGAKVVVNDLGASLEGEGHDAGPAGAVVAEIETRGGTAVANADSVATEEGGKAIVGQALAAFGRVDLIVNNAGNFTNARPFLDTSANSFASLWAVHVMGTMHVVRAAWPHMVGQRYGRVVNIGSQGGYYGHRGKFEYAAAKCAIHGLTLSLALEGGQHGVHANVVAPGALTRPVRSWAPASQFDEQSFSPDLVAPTVCWLLHEDCAVNGASYSVGAGNTSRIVLAETVGVQRRSPTIESIARDFVEIDAVEWNGVSNLVFPEGAVERGNEVVRRYASLALLDGTDSHQVR